MRKKPEHWQPTDHACRECGGRVVRVLDHGPTGGGNPLWRCADCNRASAAMGPECICWCGFRCRGQAEGDFLCVHTDRAKDDPVIRLALMRCGFLPDDPRHTPRVQIAMVSRSAIEWAKQEHWTPPGGGEGEE